LMRDYKLLDFQWQKAAANMRHLATTPRQQQETEQPRRGGLRNICVQAADH